jgi:hypothetical protein
MYVELFSFIYDRHNVGSKVKASYTVLLNKRQHPVSAHIMKKLVRCYFTIVSIVTMMSHVTFIVSQHMPKALCWKILQQWIVST